MFNCDIEFKKGEVISEVSKEIKKLITDDICARLKDLMPMMNEYPDGHIFASYDGQNLVLAITGYPTLLSGLIEIAIKQPEIPTSFLSNWSLN